MLTRLFRFLLVACLVPAALGTRAFAQEPRRTITNISDSLYEVREGSEVTVFLVTPDHIVLADPLSRATAIWLKAELAERFPDQAVSYVLPTHVGFLRAEGLGVFPSVQMIAHETFRDEVARAREKLPPEVADLDQNHNNRLEEREFQGSSLAAAISQRDQNGDGVVSPAELYRISAGVTGTYRTERTLILGAEGSEKRVRLVHPGNFGGPETTALLFPAERLLFAVNPPPLGVLFQASANSSPREMRDWFHTVAGLDFDVLLTGSGDTFKKADIVEAGEYLDRLWEGVTEGIKAGRTAGQLQASTLLSEYQRNPRFGERDGDIDFLYGALNSIRVEAYVAAGFGLASRNADYCTAAPAASPSVALNYKTCTGAGGWIPSGTVGLSVARGRIAVLFERRLAGQITSTRTSSIYDDVVAHRDSFGSLLLRYDVRRTGPLQHSAVFGISGASGSTGGYSNLKGGVSPAGGYYPLSFSSKRLGITAGGEIVHPIARKINVTVPIRATLFVSGTPSGLAQMAYTPPQRPIPAWPGPLDISIGVGLSYRLIHSVN